jgi:hypothetical protein
MNKILKQIDGESGFYSKLTLDLNEVEIIKNIINENYLKVISKLVKNEKSIDNYLYLLDNKILNDNKIWTKENRILESRNVKKIKELKFFKELEKNFGEIKITNEENIEKEEMYWRIVRPEILGGSSDVGPAHADSWFWNKTDNIIGKRRIKIWISIIGDEENSGFKYIFGSHKKKWHYETQIIEGKIKPKLNNNLENEEFHLFKTKSGGTIIFNDDLIHGGYVLKSKMRVSLEWTMLINKE